MKINAYQHDANRTVPENTTLTVNANMLHAVTGLCAESGEIASEVQHAIQERRDLNVPHVLEELGDVCWFVAALCKAFGVKMDDVLAANIEKLKKRYPDGFDVERSVHRHEVDAEANAEADGGTGDVPDADCP